MDDPRAGAALRSLRRRRRLRQLDVAVRAEVDQTTVSRIERSHLTTLSVATLRRVFSVVDARVDVEVRWRGGELDRLIDEEHAALCAAVARRLSSRGWEVHPEVTFSVFGERGSIDLLAWFGRSRALLVVEVKTQLVSVEETLRRLDAKRRLAARIARDRMGIAAAIVGIALVLPERSSVRNALRRHAAVLGPALPGHAADVRRWLGDPRGDLAAVWILSSTRPRTGKQRSVAPSRVRVSRADPPSVGRGPRPDQGGIRLPRCASSTRG